jgi:hypothetical protein
MERWFLLLILTLFPACFLTRKETKNCGEWGHRENEGGGKRGSGACDDERRERGSDD